MFPPAPVLRVLRRLLADEAPRERAAAAIYDADTAWRWRWHHIEGDRLWEAEKARRAAAGDPVDPKKLRLEDSSALLKILYRPIGDRDPIFGVIHAPNPLLALIPRNGWPTRADSEAA